MSDDLRYRVGELFGPLPPCDHLQPAELEALLDGRLPASRLAAWREHANGCDACAALRDEMADFDRLLQAGPLPAEAREFRRTDARVRRSLGLGRAARPRTFSSWALAAVAALVFLTVMLVPGRRPVLIESLPEIPMSPPPAVRSAPAIDAWTEAGRAWDAGDMPAVVRILDREVASTPDEPTLRFYLGFAQLRAGDATGAVTSLRRAAALQDPPWEITRWVLAAALERSGRFREACDELRSVADLGGARADEARRLAAERCPPPR